jgi:hypothetical protein
MLEKPTAKREEARWLEVHEAALLLESARTYQPINPWTPQDGKPADRDPNIPFIRSIEDAVVRANFNQRLRLVRG